MKPALDVGDLVMWCGKQTEGSMLRQRVIYLVTAKTETNVETVIPTGYPSYRYYLRPAFDFERPTGQDMSQVSWSSHDLKLISLLDLCTMRLHFDSFIRWWAKTQGLEDTGDRPEDGRHRPAATEAGESADTGAPATHKEPSLLP